MSKRVGKAAKSLVRAAVEVGKAAAMLPFYCGYVSPPDEPVNPLTHSKKVAVHDHDGKKIVFTSRGQVKYNRKVHGKLTDWKEEGDTVHEVKDERGNLKEKWVHDHKANKAWEYTSLGLRSFN